MGIRIPPSVAKLFFIFHCILTICYGFSLVASTTSVSPTTTRTSLLQVHQLQGHTSSSSHDDNDLPLPLPLSTPTPRRQFLLSTTSMAAATLLSVSSPQSSLAANRFILDEETGEYVEIQDEDWQTAWKQRLDKASTMSTDEIFQAARGAGNVQLKNGEEESLASKKRRAMSACRDSTIRSKVSTSMTEIECTGRVLNGGEVDFILTAL